MFGDSGTSQAVMWGALFVAIGLVLGALISLASRRQPGGTNTAQPSASQPAAAPAPVLTPEQQMAQAQAARITVSMGRLNRALGNLQVAQVDYDAIQLQQEASLLAAQNAARQAAMQPAIVTPPVQTVVTPPAATQPAATPTPAVATPPAATPPILVTGRRRRNRP